MEERRFLVAVALSLLVLVAYQWLLGPTPPTPPKPAPTASASPDPAMPSPGPTRAEAPPPRPNPKATPAATIVDEKERRVEVEGDDFTLAFSNKGARLISWQLKHFHDSAGRPEEMVQATTVGPRPLDLETGQVDADERLREVLFEASSESVRIQGQRGELRFRYGDGDLEAEKWMRFRGGYLVEVGGSVRRGGQSLPVRLVWGPGLGNPTAAETEVRGYQPPQAVVWSDKGVERLTAEQLSGERRLEHSRWLGVESKYFAAILVPPAGGQVLRSQELASGAEDKKRRDVVTTAELGVEGRALVFVGPKDYFSLTKLGLGLERVVPVGEWIGPIVVPLMRLFRWVNTYVGNYGWSVVALTVVINLVMAPFRHYSIASGFKMAKIAPEMRAIQERYRKYSMLDPRRQDMNQEMTDLYARHGMNMSTQMMVGCLPLLLTMPFLVAFYRVLDVSIELRGAPFLWVSDLSQKDPYFLAPVLMGVSMFLMQKMTPTTMDPAQQRIMLIMPIVLSVMFFFAPAGLNVYWLASNVCAIVQQGITLKLLKDREVHGREIKRKERRRA